MGKQHALRLAGAAAVVIALAGLVWASLLLSHGQTRSTVIPVQEAVQSMMFSRPASNDGHKPDQPLSSSSSIAGEMGDGGESQTCDFTFTSECEVCGPVDDCLCTVEAVNGFNTDHFFPRLRELVRRPFFKYFYVNLHGECTVWPDDEELCTSSNCAVRECEDDASFAAFETSPTMVSYSNYSCLDLNAINDTVTAKELSMLQSEQRRDAQDRANFCVADEHVFPQSEMQWVNLLDNPERYTGYSGKSARRIWEAVYSSNCFQTQSQDTFYRELFGDGAAGGLGGGFGEAGVMDMDMGMEADAGRRGEQAQHKEEEEEEEEEGGVAAWSPSAGIDVESLCLEERFFFRLLSGVHASISVHLSYKWLDQDTGRFAPNITEFRRRFSDSTTNGQGTRWLKNLYFTYLTVLKAIVKAENLWRSYPFSTGDAGENDATRAAVLDLVQQAQLYCDMAVDEEALFQTPDRSDVLDEMRQHLRQITEIMNCVGCLKCRLWGKLQVRQRELGSWEKKGGGYRRRERLREVESG